MMPKGFKGVTLIREVEQIDYSVERKIHQEKEEHSKEWRIAFDRYLFELIDELQIYCLNPLGLSVGINHEYAFSGRRTHWFAAYEAKSRQIENGIISIGINYPLLYSEMCKRHIEQDRFNIEAQARITIGHEIGHGLVDFIKTINLGDSDLKEIPSVRMIIRCGAKREETIVEEFGEYQFPEATGQWNSILSDAIDELVAFKSTNI